MTPPDLRVLRPIAFVFAIGFFIIASLAYIPGVVDEHGLTFGLYHLDLHDDILHALSGVWALVAALVSARQCLWFFRIFGTIYFLDGAIGLLTGKNVLNFHIFTSDPAITGMKLIGVNAPHILIGGGAMLIGFVLVALLRKAR
ncbi:MAG: hypothetical protein V4682_03950 [Patescibacteria group bacterium]